MNINGHRFFWKERRFWERTKFFVKMVSFKKNERWTNALDRSEKWKNDLKSFERYWKTIVFLLDQQIVQQLFRTNKKILLISRTNDFTDRTKSIFFWTIEKNEWNGLFRNDERIETRPSRTTGKDKMYAILLCRLCDLVAPLV